MKFILAVGVVLLSLRPLGAATLVTNQSSGNVIGQPSLASVTPLDPPTASSLKFPEGVAYDAATGKIYVADSGNSRVLRFASAAAFTNGAAAEAVFGQPDFATNTPGDASAPTANKLTYPYTPAVDSAGTLWVPDSGNSRVLGFKNAAILDSNPIADVVLGQPDFASSADGASPTQMRAPAAVSVGPDNTLWVADTGNSRVLRFASATQLVNGAAADGVLGQPDFTSSSGDATAETLRNPYGLWADAGGRLWVADSGNFRVLRFDNAASVADADGAPANGVLGQPSFTSGASGVTAATFGNPAISGPTSPYNVFVAADGTLWATDYVNHRLLGFRNAANLANGAPASIVLGQPDFTSSASGTAANQLNTPGHASAGPNGTFLVADYANNRVLVFAGASTPAAPTLTITTRSSATKKSKIVVAGRTTGAVSAVTYKVASKSGRAAGTTSWKFTAKLKPGRNVITVTATGPGGASAPKKITITRK